MRWLMALVLVACGGGATDGTGSTSETTEPPPPFAFYTPAWEDGGDVPTPYTCDGEGGWPHQLNPELVWENPPEGTAGFVMVFDDPDAGDWPHWAFFTDDAALRGIPEGVSGTADLPAGVVELQSGDGRTGYVPNCPGGAVHEYRWRLWAVSEPVEVPTDARFDDLIDAARAVSLEQQKFTGVSDAGG